MTHRLKVSILCRINLAAALVTKNVLGRQMRCQGGPSYIQAQIIFGQWVRTAENKQKNPNQNEWDVRTDNRIN